MNPEKIGVHAWILSNGSHWQTGDWTKFLNTQAIELSADRLSRPLSNFVEVVDTKWRAWAWNFITPHPSLSLQWPFMFILLPWLLYRTLVNMGCFPLAALTGVCIYLASPGFLGPLVMLFHPAKNLANFFGILGLYCFSLNYKKLPSLPQNGGRGVVIAGYSALFLGFLSDETGLYVYLAALLLFHRLWIRLWQEKHYGLLSGWLILPVLYLISIQIILPYLHWIVLGSHVHLNGYESYPSIKSLFWPDWSMLWLNSRFLFADHPHWLINYKQLAEYPLLWTIQAVYVLTFLYLIFLFFKSLSRSDVQQKAFLKLLAIGIVLMAGYCFFQTFQLSRNAKAWGVWWYGSLFSL
ncbi:MAG: hypothetical protein KGJ11_05990, partial [Candidatus Omnitrophica bacterium]|nr:hypothetical protein [Candidatus Omnitrophota bacterium]